MTNKYRTLSTRERVQIQRSKEMKKFEKTVAQTLDKMKSVKQPQATQLALGF